MQTWSEQNISGAPLPKRKFLTTILIVFSLAGLVIGFAVGGLTHPQTAATNSTNLIKQPTRTVQTAATATPTATPAPDVVLGPPLFNPYPTVPESAANNTQYTVSIQAADKKKKPVHASDITCKIWLVQQIPADKVLDIDPNNLKNVANLSQPIQGMLDNHPVEEIPGLTFDPTTTQTTSCDANGQFTWKYTVAPAVPPGTYDLVILTDWKGKHYNWSWGNIIIK